MRKCLCVVSLVLILMVSTSALAAVPQPETAADAPALTRGGEFAAMLVKAAELEGDGEPSEILVQHGIMKGVPGKGDDSLRPPFHGRSSCFSCQNLRVSRCHIPARQHGHTFAPPRSLGLQCVRLAGSSWHRVR